MKGSSKFFFLLLAAASGSASLAYQVVWMRRLSLVFGSTTLATSTVLAAFLGGLAIGTWVWGREADRRPQSALIILAAIEIATGLYGLASLWIFRAVEAMYLVVYPSLAERAILFTSVQFVLSACCIVPPAILMGGALPLLARRIASPTSGIAGSAGAIYGWNTLGAAAGAAATTYGLLPAVGLRSTVALAAAVNTLVGVAAWGVDKRRHNAVASRVTTSARLVGRSYPASQGMALPILTAFAVSGFAATSFEVSWGRLLAMVMGSSVYAYGTLVVVILAGLGLGSAFYGRAQRTLEEHQRQFAALECLIAFSAALSMVVLPRLPFLFFRLFSLFRNAFGWQIAAHFVAASMVALLPSLLFGATFPAVVGSLGGSPIRSGRTIGVAYAANTIGSVTGAFLAGFVLIPMIGLRATMTLGVLATLGAGTAIWWRTRNPKRRSLLALTPAAAALLIVGILPIVPRVWPQEVFAAGVGFFAPRAGDDHTVGQMVGGMRLLYYRDGIGTTISVDETGGNLYYRSNGKTDASTDPIDVADQLLLGHLPMLLNPSARDVFVLGLGTGMTAAAVARYPSVQRIDIVELEPAAKRAARFFDAYTRKVLDDPRVHLIVGDGRNRLLGMPTQYDVVISDPSDIWVAGTGSLYTLEYYRTVAARLKSGGVFAQWIHTHTLLPGDLDLLAATFRDVFPHMQIWTSAPGNLILLGTRDSVAWSYSSLKKNFDETPGVAEDLQLAGIWHPFALFGAQILGENETGALTRDVSERHTDDRPVLEFRTPRSLYVDTATMIVNELNRFVLTGAPAIAGFDPQRDLDADGAYLLGFAYASMGRSGMALPYMQRSTELDPKNPLYFVGLGNEYHAAGRDSDAGTAYERALSLDLNNVEALVSLGEIRLAQGQLDWTRVLADRALRLAPQDVRVHDLVGKLQIADR